MTKLGERTVLLLLLQLTGKEWEGRYRPEDIRLDPEKVEFLLNVQLLVADPTNDLTAEIIRDQAPKFADQFQQVLLREL